MKTKLFFVVFIVALIIIVFSIYGNKTEITLSGIDLSVYPSSAEYVLVDFHGHDVINKPVAFHFYQNSKDKIIAKYTKELFKGSFIVKGDVQKENIEVTPVHNNYPYGGGYKLTDDSGKLLVGVKYIINNKCDPHDSYSGVAGGTGMTLLFTTSVSCDINIDLIDFNANNK
ncbi:hypothetical protein MXM41_03065 [Leclercia adecarboxylata]|uniref:hypothetical protein n=1 Tax=Leclercia adecarboxylata TaxID=83655 RepID=UPI002DB63AD8|nr:hypothetical protein [Leclercia adecarboxylata]MEB6377928.1 hypothetical protein [Leclercia adecarboxylata]